MNRLLQFYMALTILAAAGMVSQPAEKKYVPTTYRIAAGQALTTSYTLNPGDSLLFERGGKWTLSQTLALYLNGNSSSGVYVGAYGTGAQPILTSRTALPNATGAGNTGRWTQYRGRDSVWAYKFSSGLQQINHRLWLDKKEAKHAYFDFAGGQMVDSVNRNQRFSTAYSAHDTLLVYAPGVNPAMFYNTIEYAGETGATVELSGSYYTVEGLDIQGGNVVNTQVLTSRNFNIKYNTLGRSAGHTGVSLTDCRDGLILGNEIHSGDSIIHWQLYQQGVGDGVLVDKGCHRLNIWQNYIHDWGHSNFEILLLTGATKPVNQPAGYWDNGYLLSDINYEYNLSRSPNVDYNRHTALDVDTGWARYTKKNSIRLRYNWMDSARVLSQLGCQGAVFAFNVVSRTTSPLCTVYANTDAGFALSFGPYNMTTPKDMLIYGNTIVYNESGGLKFQGNTDPTYDTIARNLFVNNLIAYNGSLGNKETSQAHVNGVQVMVEHYGTPSAAALKCLSQTFQNNLIISSIPNNTYFSNIYTYPNFAKSYTYFTTSAAADLGWTITGNVTGDPLFQNAGGNDFRLLSGSPAIAAGYALPSPYNVALNINSVWPGSVTVDTKSAPFSIGAFNYGAVAAIPSLIIKGRKIKTAIP